MKKLFFYAGLLSLLVAVGCKNGNEPTPTPKPDPAKPIELKSAAKVADDNAFTFDLLRATRKHSDDANVFISPLSVSMALNMTLNGAAGQTADEMRTALRESGYTMADINDYSRELREALLRVDPSTEIGIANSIWCHEDLTVKAPFTDVNRAYYDAEVEVRNLSLPATIDEINDWCSRKTKGRIPEVLKEPSDALMYLINAIYFKGAWANPFEKEFTEAADFHRADGSTQKVQMMHLDDEFRYAVGKDCRFLEMDYGNGAFSMVVVLPNEGKTTRDVIATLDGKTWAETMSSMSHTFANVKVRLPQFKAECEYQMQDGILPDLGMRLPFSMQANFSGISDSPLMISRVIHKTFVEVNEEGTEAAAVTVVEMVESSAGPDAPKPKWVEFTVDRPFLFVIREKSTGVILFIGEIGEI